MSIFSDIRDGFVTVVEAAIIGLRIYPKLPDGLLEYPCMVVQPTGDVEYRQLIGAHNILYLLKARSPAEKPCCDEMRWRITSGLGQV